MKLSVMTFNLRVDLGVSERDRWECRIKKISKIINENSPLIFGTQEGLFRMLEDIKDNLEGYDWIGEGREEGRDGEYCAIFYNIKKLILIDKGQFWLSESPEQPGSVSWESACPRICTWAHFKFSEDDNKEFIVYNTHLDHISQKAREEGIKLIVNKIKEMKSQKNLPAILMGDFNSTPENTVVKFLRGEVMLENQRDNFIDSYSLLDGDIGITFHDFKGGEKGEPIDFIFVTPEIKMLEVAIKREKIYGGYPSDHYPLIAQVEI